MYLKTSYVLLCILINCLLSPEIYAGGLPKSSVAVYLGKFYNSSPIELLSGTNDTHFEKQYITAALINQTLWEHPKQALALELEGMLGAQFGKADLIEFAFAPTIRWQRFPWNKHLRTTLRLAPLGFSYTSSHSPLEPHRTTGQKTLNYLSAELAFTLPQQQANKGEVLVRLQHRCTVFNLLGNDVKNGSDFLGVGYRKSF